MISKTLRGWLRFLAIFTAVTIPFAAFRISAGAAEPIPMGEFLNALPIILLATLSGAYSYAATERWRSSTRGYYASWAVSGAVTGAAGTGIGVVAFVLGGANPLESILTGSVVGVGAMLLLAITGVAYG